jgi:hypothetical protein
MEFRPRILNVVSEQLTIYSLKDLVDEIISPIYSPSMGLALIERPDGHLQVFRDFQTP